MMKQLVLIPPVIDEHQACLSAIVGTDKSNLVIIRDGLPQHFRRDLPCRFNEVRSRQFPSPCNPVKFHSPIAER